MIISRRLKSEAATVWGGTLRSGNLIDAKIVLTFNLHPCVWLLIKYIRFVSFPWSHCPPLRRRIHRSTVYKPGNGRRIGGGSWGDINGNGYKSRVAFVAVKLRPAAWCQSVGEKHVTHTHTHTHSGRWIYGVSESIIYTCV